MSPVPVTRDLSNRDLNNRDLNGPSEILNFHEEVPGPEKSLNLAYFINVFEQFLKIYSSLCPTTILFYFSAAFPDVYIKWRRC
jgi:hypothetical protein